MSPASSAIPRAQALIRGSGRYKPPPASRVAGSGDSGITASLAPRPRR